MNTLSNNWITDGLIDFEYKKYVLLSYLKHIDSEFDQGKLYPALSDLISHFRNLIHLRESKRLVQDGFPKEATKIDWAEFNIEYDRLINDDEYISQIDEILTYSIPAIGRKLQSGKKIYEHAEKNLVIFPIGVIPIFKEEGYLLVKVDGKRQTDVYEYKIALFEHADQQFRGIKTAFVKRFEESVIDTFETIKLDLLKENKRLPNPATYVLKSTVELPREETLMPIGKRMLVRYIAEAA